MSRIVYQTLSKTYKLAVQILVRRKLDPQKGPSQIVLSRNRTLGEIFRRRKELFTKFFELKIKLLQNRFHLQTDHFTNFII